MSWAIWPRRWSSTIKSTSRPSQTSGREPAIMVREVSLVAVRADSCSPRRSSQGGRATASCQSGSAGWRYRATRERPGSERRVVSLQSARRSRRRSQSGSPAPSKQESIQRRGRDSNPRTGKTRSTVFKTAAFNRSATPPDGFATASVDGVGAARASRVGLALTLPSRPCTVVCRAAHVLEGMPWERYLGSVEAIIDQR